MGRIFSWEEVSRKAIPERADFDHIADECRLAAAGNDSILDAMFCGSFLRGDYCPRSDLDLVVIYDPARRDEAALALRMLRLEADAFSVPLEIIAASRDAAKNAFHTIHFSLLGHMHWAREHGGTIKGDPLRHTKPLALTPREDILGYVAAKMNSLEKMYFSLGDISPQTLRFIQLSLEAPENLSRSMLPWDGRRLLDRSKENAIRHFMSKAGRAERRLVEELLAIDERYEVELHRQLMLPSETEYETALRTILGRLEDKAIRLVSLAAERFSRES